MQPRWREGKALDSKAKGHLRGGTSERRPKLGKPSPVEISGGFEQKEELCKAPTAEVNLVMRRKERSSCGQGRAGRARSWRALDPEPGSGPYSKCAVPLVGSGESVAEG